MSGYCSLQASLRPPLPIGAMHLAERGGGGRLVLEALEARSQSGPSSAAMRRLTKFQPIGGAFACSVAQLLRIFRRQRVGHGREHLRHLHERALETAQGRGQVGRVARAIERAPQHAFAGEPRRGGADRGPDLGVAADAPGEPVALPAVGHRAIARKSRRIGMAWGDSIRVDFGRTLPARARPCPAWRARIGRGIVLAAGGPPMRACDAHLHAASTA